MKKFFKLVALMLSLALVLGAVACGDPEGKVLVSTVALDRTNIELEVGDQQTLKATITPNNATNKKVAWSSSDPMVALVDANGKVTAVNKGVSIITVKTEDGNRIAQCSVLVTNPDSVASVTGVKLNKSSLSIDVAESVTLKATVQPADAANKNVIWASTNPSVVNVSASGVVTGLQNGTATVYVTTVDGNHLALCTVKVGTGSGGNQPAPTIYTVTFNSNGGTAVNAQSVVDGSTATMPTAPTKAADANYTYTFAGWFLNNVAYNFSTPVTGNITLTAKWTATPIDPVTPPAITTYTVTFNPNGGTAVASQTINKNATATRPADPTRAADANYTYTFAGWFLNNVAYDFSTPVTGNITLVAKWNQTAIEPEQPGEGGEGGGVEAPYHVQFGDLDINTTGTIKVLRPQNENEDAILDAAIEGFNEIYPGITVEKAPVSINDYERTIYLQYTANRLPEIIWTNSSNYYYLVTNGMALNLDQFMIDAEDDGTFIWDKTEDFNGEFHAMGLYNGSRYAVPRSIDSVVTFYNTEIMDAIGIDMTQYEDGWTWEDFLEVCAAIRAYYDGQGRTNFYCVDPYLGWESVAWPIVKSLGGHFINENGEFALTQSKAAAVYNFVHTLIDNNYIPGQGESAANSFESADCPLLFQSTTIKNMASKASLDGKFNLLPFPLINGEDSAIGTGFAGYAINSKVADDQDKLNMAGAFMAYLMSYDGQQKIALDGGLSSPSIRADLGTDNDEAEWHKSYSDTYNTSAYTWGSQYKVGMEFLENSDSELASTIIGYLGTYVGDYAKRYTLDAAYSAIIEDIQADQELAIANGLYDM